MVYIINNSVSVSVGVDEDSRKASVWKETLLVILASLPFLTQGIQADALTSTAHTGHFTSKDHIPWSTTTYILAAMLSAPVFCYVIETFGRKVGIFIVSLVQGISCIPLLLDFSEANLIILHLFAGISLGGLYIVFPTYIREISSIPNRGWALSLMMPMTTGGYLMKLVLNLDELALLIVALVVVQMIMVCCLLESPSYLVMTGKYEVAKVTVARLKCLPSDHPAVLDNISSLKDESDRAKTKGKLHIITILRNPIWRDATKIGLVLYTIMVLCGSVIFMDQEKTLMQLRLQKDPETFLTLVSLFAGSVMGCVMIRFLERKYMLSSAFTVMVLSMGILAVYTQADLTIWSHRWVPVACLGVLLYGYGIAWGLPTVIMVELYNCEVRTQMLALLYAYSQLIKLLHVHTYLYIEDYLGIYTFLYICVGINMFGAVYCLFHVPNLKNKSTREIERQLKRVPLLKM